MAKTDSVLVLALGAQTLKEVLGNQMQAVFFKNKQKWALRNDKNGRYFTELQV